MPRLRMLQHHPPSARGLPFRTLHYAPSSQKLRLGHRLQHQLGYDRLAAVLRRSWELLACASFKSCLCNPLSWPTTSMPPRVASRCCASMNSHPQQIQFCASVVSAAGYGHPKARYRMGVTCILGCSSPSRRQHNPWNLTFGERRLWETASSTAWLHAYSLGVQPRASFVP